MVRTPPANGLPKMAAWYADRRFLVVSAPFLHARQTKPPATQDYAFRHSPAIRTSKETGDESGNTRYKLDCDSIFYCL